jgi:hypothetical protein
LNFELGGHEIFATEDTEITEEINL